MSNMYQHMEDGPRKDTQPNVYKSDFEGCEEVHWCTMEEEEMAACLAAESANAFPRVTGSQDCNFFSFSAANKERRVAGFKEVSVSKIFGNWKKWPPSFLSDELPSYAEKQSILKHSNETPKYGLHFPLPCQFKVLILNEEHAPQMPDLEMIS